MVERSYPVTQEHPEWRKLLEAIDHTIDVHGKVDRNTGLHLRIKAAIIDDWIESLDAPRPSPVAQTVQQPLAAAIAEYSRDIRRNSSGGDDYPWETMTGVADALDEILKRYPAQRPQVSPLSKRLYTMSEPHLSGYRLVIGFETLADAQDAHEAIALPSTVCAPIPVKKSSGCVFCDIKVQLHHDDVSGFHHVVEGETVPCSLSSPQRGGE